MNFIQIINKLLNYAESLHYVKSTNSGDVIDFLNGKPDIKYACVNIDITQSTRNDNLIAYDVYVLYVDRLKQDRTNAKEIKTVAEQVLESIVNYAAEKIGDIDDGYTIRFIDQKFADYLAGGEVNFVLSVPNEMGQCMIDDFELTGPDSNEIWYTSADGNIVNPYSETALPLIVSNTYINGQGIIKFASDVTSIGIGAFIDCSSLTSVTIPNSVTSIGQRAFQNCSSLTSIDIPNSVTSIGLYAFGYCSSLTSIDIPNSVTGIRIGTFFECSSLTSVTIPNSVTSISRDAFMDCISLTSITIPNSVTSIGSDAFYGCSSLTSVTIPNSVTSIGHDAFSYCSGLTNITYDGTMDEWNNISKDDNWNYLVPATVVHCTDGDVPI